MHLPRARHRSADTSASGEVVLLDQVGIEQADAMITAAAAQHRVLLRDAQLRNGLAGIEYAAAGMANSIGVTAGQRRRTGQGLQEIDGTALGGQKAARRSAHLADDAVGGNGIAVARLPANFDSFIALAKYLVEPLAAAQHRVLAHQ